MSVLFRRAPVHQRIIDEFGSVEALLEGGVDPVNEFIVLAALGALLGRIRDISPFDTQVFEFSTKYESQTTALVLADWPQPDLLAFVISDVDRNGSYTTPIMMGTNGRKACCDEGCEQ